MPCPNGYFLLIYGVQLTGVVPPIDAFNPIPK